MSDEILKYPIIKRYEDSYNTVEKEVTDKMTFEEIQTGAWKPENKGDEIIGVLINVEKDVGANSSMVYSIEVENKSISVWGSTVLDSKMVAAKIGDKVKIVYDGLGEKQPGKNAPKLFNVYVDRE